MKEKLRRLPDSELAVMQALWRADAPLTRPELDAALKSGRLAKAAFHAAAEGEDGPRRVSASGVCIDGVGESPLLLVMFAEASGGEKGPEPTTK